MDPCTYFDDTSYAIAGSTARAQHCFTRRGGGKRAVAERQADALASPGRPPEAELGSRGHAGTAGAESPSEDPELVVALQMAKQAAQAQLRPHRVRRSSSRATTAAAAAAAAPAPAVSPSAPGMPITPSSAFSTPVNHPPAGGGGGGLLCFGRQAPVAGPPAQGGGFLPPFFDCSSLGRAVRDAAGDPGDKSGAPSADVAGFSPPEP